MLILGYAYRFLSNFVFLALVYLALNFLEKYQNCVVVAVLVLVYAGMHAAPPCAHFISTSVFSDWSWRRAS